MKLIHKIIDRFRKKPKNQIFYSVKGKLKTLTLVNEDNGTFDFQLENPKAKAFFIGTEFYSVLNQEFPQKTQQIQQIQNLLETVNDLSLIQLDLNKVTLILTEISKKNNSHIFEALLIAGIVTYMKAFTKTNGRYQFQENVIPDELSKDHGGIRDLRNQYISHADLSANFESARNLVIFDEFELIITKSMQFQTQLRGASAALRLLTEYMLNHSEKLISRKSQQAQRLLNSLRKP